MVKPNNIQSQTDNRLLRLAVPSDGELQEPSLKFLASCGLPISRPSSRRYTATFRSVDNAMALFQRAADIPTKVEEGIADIGIVGMDRYQESRIVTGKTIVLLDNLGFGQCELVLAVPDLWIDVTSISDLGDLAIEFRKAGRELRIATKFPRLVQSFLYEKGINYFTLVLSSGTLEAAPAIGYADLIADLTASGATLRENGLRTLDDGVILSSQACLIGNQEALASKSFRARSVKPVLEAMEAHLRALQFCSITANVQGESPDSVAERILTRTDLAGTKGPTVSAVYAKTGIGWYSTTIIVQRSRVQDAIEHLRSLGGDAIAVSPLEYLFQGNCNSYDYLESMIGNNPDA